MLSERVSDLTVDEFKALVREVVEGTMADLLSDPDDGLGLRDEFRDALRQSLKAVKEGGVIYDANDVAHSLGLED